MLIKETLWILILTIFTLITTSHCETTENENSDVEPSEESSETNSTMAPILDATASKLVRYRIKPPVTYYRYKTQTFKRPRPRVKIPKAKHGSAIYGISEPTSYYKQQPEVYTSTQSYKPSHKPSYNSYEEVHYEVSSDYPLLESIPLTNYEAQAMDLEFYDSYPKKKAPQYEYPKPKKITTAQRPHKVYGVPKETAYHSYNSYSGNDYKTQYVPKPEVHYDVSYHEEPPKQGYGPPVHEKEEYDHFPPYGVPPRPKHQPEQATYQVPSNKYEAPMSSYLPHEPASQGGPYPPSNSKYEAPEGSYHPHEQSSVGVPYPESDHKYETPVSSHHPHEEPSNEGPYPVYEKKLPNAGYHNHFAEPPADVHITYSPSYEINPLPPKHHPSPQNNYEPPLSDNYGPPTNSYGPPGYDQKANSDYQAPGDSYHQSSGGHFAEPPGSYLPPIHHQDELPLKKNHMPPGYDYPKSSYEVPIYDAIPFESTTPDQDYFPPNHMIPQHEHVSESNNNIQQIAPQSHPSNLSPAATTTTTTTVALEPVPEANNKVHRFATRHNYRTNHVNRHESTSKFPVETEDSQTSEAPSSKYLDKILSTTSTFRPRRKRKRTKAPVTEKHNLDAPELEQAFESGHDQSEEPTALSSDIKENVNRGRQNLQNKAPVQILTEFSPSQSWNPMRIRTKAPTTPQRGHRTAESTLNELKNIEVVSIQKSHSHSYYAGTIPPRTRTFNSRADGAKMESVRATTFKAVDTVKPTRSLVIDKTYFKAKDDEGEFYDGTGELPKNHKLF